MLRLVMLLLAIAHLASCAGRAPVAQDSLPTEPPIVRLVSLAGSTVDATAAIQEILDDAARAGGGEARLPAGGYRVEGSLNIPPGVALAGVWTAPHHASLNRGTVLRAHGGAGSEQGPALIELSPGSAVRGLTIYYPDQRLESLVPYPWAIRGRGMHNTIENVTLVNPWGGIDLGTHGNELHLVRNVFGCPLKTGVYIDGCTDIGRLENVHFNPHYWSRDEGDGEPRPDQGALIQHLLGNADAFVFGRTDWQYVLNTFCYGYRAGYRFVKTERGHCNGNFLGIGADDCVNAILVEDGSPIGILITNGEFVGLNAPDPITVATLPGNRGVLQFNNCAFWGPVSQIARLEGGTTSFVQCNFLQWDAKGEGRPAFEALGGDLVVKGCNLMPRGKHLGIGEELRSLIFADNLLVGPLSMVGTPPGGKSQIAGNIER